MKNISFKNVDKQLAYKIDRLIRAVESQGEHRNKCLEDLLSYHELMTMDFTEKELGTLMQAKEAMPNSFKRTAKERLLRVANTIISSTKDDIEVNLNHRNSRLSADKRADILLNKIIEDNSNFSNENWHERIFVTCTSFQKVAARKKAEGTTETLFNKRTVDRCLERNRDKIRQHHDSLGMDEFHNLKAHHRRLEITRCS